MIDCGATCSPPEFPPREIDSSSRAIATPSFPLCQACVCTSRDSLCNISPLVTLEHTFGNGQSDLIDIPEDLHTQILILPESKSDPARARLRLLKYVRMDGIRLART